MNNIPVWNINTPSGGFQGPPMTISPNQPVYSSYTSNFISNGPIPYGTPGDAPIGHKNHGKNFHVIAYNPVNGSYMVHGSGMPRHK